MMTPFLMMKPSPAFHGHVVEYGSLVMLWGCDPSGPMIPCGYAKNVNADKCNRWKCCWAQNACYRIGYKIMITLNRENTLSWLNSFSELYWSKKGNPVL